MWTNVTARMCYAHISDFMAALADIRAHIMSLVLVDVDSVRCQQHEALAHAISRAGAPPQVHSSYS